MLTYDQAIEHILAKIEPLLVAEKSDLSVRRVLLEDISAGINLPRFDNSQMDGYAVIASDTAAVSKQSPVKLTITGEVQAGPVSKEAKLTHGQCVRIFTGAPIPSSADAVIPQEDVNIDENHIVVSEQVPTGQFVRYKGEDVEAGTMLAHAGAILSPFDIALFAAQGYDKLRLGRAPKICLLSTGNELVEPGSVAGLSEGQVYNSNSVSLTAQIDSLGIGAIVSRANIAQDTEADVKVELQKFADDPDCDLIIACGGVSVGKYDCVRPAILSMGGTLDFTSVSMRPGKPTTFGFLNGKPILGLPGNPVSAMVTFELFVRPAILRLAGYPSARCCRPLIDAILTKDVSHEPGRRSFARAKVGFVDATIRVTPGDKQRSDQISGMAQSDALLVIPEDIQNLTKDTKVKVMLLD